MLKLYEEETAMPKSVVSFTMYTIVAIIAIMVISFLFGVLPILAERIVCTVLMKEVAQIPFQGILLAWMLLSIAGGLLFQACVVLFPEEGD